MKYSNCFIRANGKQQGLFTAEPQDAVRHVVRLDDNECPGAMFIEVMWLMGPCAARGMKKCESGTMWVFMGSDVSDHENLNAEIELWIENDLLTLTETCAVFIPEGVPFGNFKVKNAAKPVLSYYCHTGDPACTPARAEYPAGTYKNNVFYKYAPPSGEIPEGPEGFLQLMLYLDSEMAAGAPYMETTWFKTDNDSGPAPHQHGFPEFIAFIGTDPEHPEELNAEMQFYMGEDNSYDSTTKSTLIYVPADILHSPIIVPQMSKPAIHFSGNTGNAYIRDNKDEGGNLYKVK
jgi:hypothetical protein